MMRLPFLIGVALLAACKGGAPDPRTDDQPTSGHVRLVADQDLRSIIDAEELVFEGLYPKATLDISYVPEAEALATMGSDSVRCTITFALPGADQAAALKERRVEARPVPAFIDGIAVVVHPDHAYTGVSKEQLRSLLDPAAPATAPLPLFVGSGSGVARSLIDSLGLTNLRGQALPTLGELIDRVATDPQVLGLVPFNAIADLDDPKVRAQRERIRILPVARETGGPGIVPNQSTLADGQYPLRRTAYMVLTEGKSGLGTGFVSFVANHKGQRIILKRGVAPIKVPAREVEVVPPQ